METPHPELERVLGLVAKCDKGTIVLPEFQRSFVWGNQDIKYRMGGGGLCATWGGLRYTRAGSG